MMFKHNDINTINILWMNQQNNQTTFWCGILWDLMEAQKVNLY